MEKKLSKEPHSPGQFYGLMVILAIAVIVLIVFMLVRRFSSVYELPAAQAPGLSREEMLNLLAAPGAGNAPPVSAGVMKNLDATKNSSKPPSKNSMDALSAPGNL